jgi:hypothetical protein
MTKNRKNPVIHCADCEHCKVVREYAPSGRYILRVRCAQGHWRRGKDGTTEATYYLHTVLRRKVPACTDYTSLSEDDDDRRKYVEDLECNLPVGRVVFNPDGSVVESLEMR